MFVFLSWSKPRSQQVAAALSDWLPDVLQEVNPWMSKKDIGAGERWSQEIAGKLEEVSFGISCVTSENVDEPWLNFEAGACSKRVKEARLVPYLFEMKPTDVTGPLAQFQAKEATKEGTLELVEELNQALGEKALPAERLRRAFEKNWSDLDKKLSEISSEGAAHRRKRDHREILEEVLQRVRSIERLQKRLPSDVVLRSSIVAHDLGKYSKPFQRFLDLEGARAAEPTSFEKLRREARALGLLDEDDEGNTE